MKKYFVVVSVVFFVLTFNFVTNQPAQAFEIMCCQNSDGCGPSPDQISCPSGFTKMECNAGCSSTMATAASAAATSTTASTTFVNPIKFSSVSEVVNALLSNLKGIIATVAILFIVIGGIMYILSAGDEKKMTTAKSTITAAMIGLAIALAAPTFLVEIENILGGGTGVDNSALGGALSLTQIVTNILNLLLSIVGILAIIGLVIGGSFYLTAYGDDKRIETGKKIITSSIIGIVIVMVALVIVKQIAALL